MLGGMIGAKLRVFRDYIKRLRDTLLLRTSWFKSYDASDPQTFVDASRFIYTVGSAVVTISAVLYFALNTSRPELYELIPLPFLATMGFVCFIMLSMLRVYRITFAEFFVCFAYVMGTYCVIWLLGRLLRAGIAIYPHQPEDGAAIPQTLRDICRNPDSPACREFRQAAGTRQLLDTVDFLLKYWELFLAIYFSAALGVFLSDRAGAQTLGIVIAIVVGLAAYFFFDRGASTLAQFWLNANDCKLKPEFAQYSIKECSQLTNSKFSTVRFYAHYRLALALEHQKERSRSVSEYINAVKYDPSFRLEPELIERLSTLGKGYAEQGHYGEAFILVSAALQRRPWDAQLLTRRGAIQMDAGNLEAALKDFTDAADRDSTFADAHYYLGLILERRNDWRTALERHQHAIKLHPTPRYLRASGRVRSMIEDYDGALNDTKAAIALDENDAKSYYEKAEVYRRWQKPEQAKPVYLKAIDLDPKDADIHRALARMHEDLKNYDISKVCAIPPSRFTAKL